MFFLLALYTILIIYLTYLLLNINIDDDRCKNIMFIKLKTTGENPFHDKISSMDIKYINNDTNSEDDTTSEDTNSEDDINSDSEIEPRTEDNILSNSKEDINTSFDCIDDMLHVNFKDMDINDTYKKLIEVITYNIPFDGKLYIVGFNEEIKFIINYLNKFNISTDKIIFVDNYTFAQKTIKPYDNNNTSWWGNENNNSLYNFDNIIKYLNLDEYSTNIEIQYLLYKKLCEENNLTIYDIDKVVELLKVN